MVILLSFILFLGGFIYGMFLLRSGLIDLSQILFKKWSIKPFDEPWKCMLIGIVSTLILQNIVAILFITSKLVSRRLLTFHQMIGIVLGSYIGKTITSEIITINVEAFMIPMVLIGAILCFIKGKYFENIGYVLIGFSLVFGAMWGFKITAPLVIDIIYIKDFFLNLSQNNVFALFAGAAFTAITQSSTATTGLTMSFLSSEMINLSTGVAIILGANLGTCIVMLLSSIGSGNEARLTTLSYTWLNIFCVVLIYPFINLLVSIGINLSSQPDVQLAHIIVIFHIIASLIFLPFIKQFGKFILTVHNYNAYK